MSGNRIIIDTNIIIFISKQKINIEELLSRYDEFFVSIVTYMEVYRFDFEDETEKLLIDAFFDSVEIVDINMPIADIVVSYKKNNRRKMKLPDAIILASAKFLQADLLSDDWDDFINIDPNVKILNINNLKNKRE